MKLFIDKLIKKVDDKNSHICVGLDPHLDLLPSFLINEVTEDTENIDAEVISKVIFKFNKIIIDRISDIAVAVKPQIAFYELHGKWGIDVLFKTIKYAQQKDLLVILDAKRNDIGSTAQAYAESYFGFANEKKDQSLYESSLTKSITADAITINPYLGSDGIRPFLKKKSKGAFALVRTSNESAREFQDVKLENGKTIYQKMGALVTDWGQEVIGENGYSNLGAVIGATYPEELKLLRKEMPSSYFLIPGYGFQGGGAADIIAGFKEDNKGALINSSRGIIFAYCKGEGSEQFNEEEFGSAARKAALQMKNEINQAVNYKK